MVKYSRNEPCPCGSGKKYKKCHGMAVINARNTPVHQSYSLVPAVRTESAQKPRPCGSCSLCCDGWVKTRVLGHDIDLGSPCPYSSGADCTIHETRPDDPCRIFYCGWAEAESPLPDWLQPSLSRVIVLFGRATCSGHPVDVLVSAGKDPDEKILQWFQEYSVKHMRPFLYQRNEKWFAFGPEEFQQIVLERMANGEALFH